MGILAAKPKRLVTPAVGLLDGCGLNAEKLCFEVIEVIDFTLVDAIKWPKLLFL